MMSRITVLAVCVCMVGFVMFSFAQEEAKPVSGDEEQAGQKDPKKITGIVVQIVLFILFLGVIYYVFIHPEKPKEEGEDIGSSSSEEDQEKPSEESSEEEQDQDAGGEEKEDAGAEKEEEDTDGTEKQA